MRFVIAVVAASLFLVACASAPVQPSTSGAAQAAAALSQSGDHAQAAAAWEQAAGQSRGSASDLAWLRAAQSWFLAGRDERARIALKSSNPRRLNRTDRLAHQLLDARFLIGAQSYSQALNRLQMDDFKAYPEQAGMARVLRAQALLQMGHVFESASELAFVAHGADAVQRAQALESLAKTLQAISDNELTEGARSLSGAHPLYPYAARELAMRGLTLPHPVQLAPGNSHLPAPQADGYQQRELIAVLLPNSGNVAAAGNAVRDGILAAYYQDNRPKAELRFFDTSQEGGAKSAYLQAVAAGAHLVIGPLEREQIVELFPMAAAQMPILALNRSDVVTPLRSVTFALSPEDEGASAAKRASLQGLKSAMIILEYDETGRRAAMAFAQQFKALGGQILIETTIDGGLTDHTVQIDLLKQRATRADLIYLGVRGKTAHLLMPQLLAADMDKIPKYASSLILSGTGDPRFDRDLDGIEYPDIPFLLGQYAHIPEPEQLGALLPNAMGASARLFALGYDAWNLSGYLEHMRQSGSQLRGATGVLSIDDQGIVHRDPAWAIFSGGLPKAAPDGGLMLDVRNPENRGTR